MFSEIRLGTETMAEALRSISHVEDSVACDIVGTFHNEKPKRAPRLAANAECDDCQQNANVQDREAQLPDWRGADVIRAVAGVCVRIRKDACQKDRDHNDWDEATHDSEGRLTN